MKNITKNTVFILSVIAPSIAFTSVQEEMQRFQKCYGILVGERVPSTDALWLKVKEGSVSGTDACMATFDRAKLSVNGEVKKVAGNYDQVGTKILSNFMKFHKSQLQIPDYGKVIGTASERYTRDVIDTNEAVYHFVYSVFGDKQKYSDTITRNYSLKAERDTKQPEQDLF